jgi:hypothetical protein
MTGNRPKAGGRQLQPETPFCLAVATPDARSVLDYELPNHSCTNELCGDFDRSPALQTSRPLEQTIVPLRGGAQQGVLYIGQLNGHDRTLRRAKKPANPASH